MRRLGARMTILLGALLAVVSIVFVMGALHLTRVNMQQVDQSLNQHIASETLAHYLPTISKALAHQGGVIEFDLLMAINPNAEFYVLDLDGRIVAHRATPGRVMLDRVALEPVNQLLSGHSPLPVLGMDPKEPGAKKAFSAARIVIDGRESGFLYAVLGGEAYRTAMNMFSASHALQLTLGALAATVLAAFAAGAFAFNRLTRKISSLSDAMQAFEQGKFRQQPQFAAPVVAADEVDLLAKTYTAMADRIASQFADLESMDRSRRELLSHISHDLRTPLATLQAYLETVTMKGDELAPEQRHSYILAATQFAQKIGLMTADLFEFATLDLHNAPMRPEKFSLAELLSDIGQRFGLDAGGKGVRLQIDIAAPGPVVEGDIGLIERLFANLIDNAVKYTPAGGQIVVSMDSQPGHVVVCVADTGVGIPAADLERIFETFQRVEQSSGRVGGTGLGLAIAKRVAELHRGDIRVESEPGRGSKFFVRLPRPADETAIKLP